MKDFNIIFSDTAAPQLPNGVCLGSVGEHNAVQLVITLPESMLTGITFYTITVGGIESAQIVSGSQNVDGAYLLDGVIYQPLTAAYTTQRITDLTVTAYARENGETVVVDKTQTVCGLMFIEGHPAPVPGGIVSEVAKLAEEVAAIEDDIPTSEEIAAWNEAAADKHTHANKPTLDKFGESNGSPTFDGDPIGGLGVVEKYSDLSDGDVSLVEFDEKVSEQILLVDNISVSVPVLIGNLAYNDAAIGGAIAAQSLGGFGLIFSRSNTMTGGVLPVVADISDNEYVDAGITLDADETLIAANTKKYAVSLLITATGIDLVNPTKIIEVDAGHVQIPFMAIYAFEALSNVSYRGITMDLAAGWNLALGTVDKETYSDLSAIDIVNSININDYVLLDTIENVEIVGENAAELFAGLLEKHKYINKGLYVNHGQWQPAKNIHDATMLTFKEYDNLYVRDTVTDSSIHDVPVYVPVTIGSICKLLAADETGIDLHEARQTNGDPVRIIKILTDVTDYPYIWSPVTIHGALSDVPAGWSKGGVSTTAPDVSGFTPDRVVVNNQTYTDLESIPDYVRSALYSLSQCVNETASAMGHINIPDDAVVSYAGKIEPNRKYLFITDSDFSLTLPDVGFSEEDAQFVMYLTCTDDGVDITLPSNVLLSGEIDTSEGNHKLIGCWLKDIKKWAVGSITYEAVSE